MQAVVEQVTWFWQDLFKVYIPRVTVSAKMQDAPVPRFVFLFFRLIILSLCLFRTEYKDDDIEFVLENLYISSFNILPSHVYIRNITVTDVDILTSSSSAPSRTTAVGTLSHVRCILAMQLFLYFSLHLSIFAPFSPFLTGNEQCQSDGRASE